MAGVFYRLLELGLLETDAGRLALTMPGLEALQAGQARTLRRELMRLLVDPEGRVLEARRVQHSGRRRGDMAAGASIQLDVSRLQEFVDSVPNLRAADATVVEVRMEGQEVRLVRHRVQARLDLEARTWHNVVLDRGGQPSPALGALAARLDWKTVLELSGRSPERADLWTLDLEDAFLADEVTRQARKLTGEARRSLEVRGADLCGEGAGRYEDLLRARPELRLVVGIPDPSDEWKALSRAFGRRVSLRPAEGLNPVLVADDQRLEVTSGWVGMDNGRTGREVLVGRLRGLQPVETIRAGHALRG